MATTNTRVGITALDYAHKESATNDELMIDKLTGKIYYKKPDGVIVDPPVSGASSAAKVDHSLTVAGKTFDGSAAVTITTAELGAALPTDVIKATDFGTASKAGVVKSTTADNGVTVDPVTGVMTVNAIDATKILGTVHTANKVSYPIGILGKIYDGSEAVLINNSDILKVLPTNLVKDTDIATAAKVGVVKGSAAVDTIAVGADGTMTINNISGSKVQGGISEAAKVKNPLTVAGKTFDGSVAVTITTAELGAALPADVIKATDFGGADKAGVVKSTTAANGVSVGADGTMTINSIAANKITGAVDSANKLATSRTINGVAFDGTTNITVVDDTKIPLSAKGVANGIAVLDAASQVPSANLPSYVDDVIEAASLAALNALPAAEKMSGKIYVSIDTNTTYRWTGTAFISISNPLDFATKAEAETATDSTKVMSPIRVKESIMANAKGGIQVVTDMAQAKEDVVFLITGTVTK